MGTRSRGARWCYQSHGAQAEFAPKVDGALTKHPVKGGESLLGAAQQGVEVSGQDTAGAGVSQGAVSVVTLCVPASRKVPTGLCGAFQIEPQLLFRL